jgi:hypothetical protein
MMIPPAGNIAWISPVSSSNAPNSPQNGKVTGTTVGPLGQAERKGNPIANSPDQEPIQVNLVASS